LKKGHNYGTLWPGTQTLYHDQLHDTLIMCSKFHLDDLKTVGGF